MKRKTTTIFCLGCAFLLLLPSLAVAGQLGQGGGSAYPSALDTKTTYTNKADPCVTSISTRICKETFNDPQDAIVKIETELGLLPKGGYATVVARLNAGVYIGTAGASLTAASGGLIYSTSTSLAVQSAGASGYFVRSGGTAAPTWFDLFGTANTFTAAQTLSLATPSFVLTDTTALAKSLTIAVGSNVANFRESAGAAGSLLALDLANNRVGVGTASPNSLLTIGAILTGWAGGTTASSTYIVGSNQPAFNATGQNLFIGTNTSQAADIGGSIGLGGYYTAQSASIDFATISGRKENGTAGNTAGYLQFATRINAGNMTEAMRITSTGNVGIGTTSPNVGLEMGATLNVRIPSIKSTTGVRYVCVDTLGNLTSQAAACSGT